MNRLVLAGHKTATAGLLRGDYQAEDEAVEHVGEHLVLIDNGGGAVARVEVTGVEVVAFDAVTWEFAAAEGEGFVSIDDWRTVTGGSGRPLARTSPIRRWSFVCAFGSSTASR